MKWFRMYENMGNNVWGVSLSGLSAGLKILSVKVRHLYFPCVVNDLQESGQRNEVSVHSCHCARSVHGVYHPHLKKCDAV